MGPPRWQAPQAQQAAAGVCSKYACGEPPRMQRRGYRQSMLPLVADRNVLSFVQPGQRARRLFSQPTQGWTQSRACKFGPLGRKKTEPSWGTSNLALPTRHRFSQRCVVPIPHPPRHACSAAALQRRQAGLERLTLAGYPRGPPLRGFECGCSRCRLRA